MDARQLVNDFFIEQAAPAQTFSVNVALSSLKGAAEVDWTTCFERQCRKIPNDFDMKLCKGDCQWRSMNVLITRINGLRANCRKTANPTGCLKVLDNAVKAERNSQRKVREQMTQIRRQKEEFRRKEALRR